MTDLKYGRRGFLKRAGQGLAAVPLLAAMPSFMDAQKGSKNVESAAPSPKVHLNVREMGAKGGGTTKDTLAFQQALDRADLLGGGEVLVPPGDYLTGPLMLRSNTTLRIEEGASLLGSPDIADYPLTQVRW